MHRPVFHSTAGPRKWTGGLLQIAAALAAVVLLGPSLSAQAPKQFPTGGLQSPPRAHQIVTPQKFQVILNTPSANTSLMNARAKQGGKLPEVLPDKRKSLLTPGRQRDGFASFGDPAGRGQFSFVSTVSQGKEPALPGSVDWRNREGNNDITEPKNQEQTMNCWAYASVGVIEAMVRIEHGVWCERSVTEMRQGCKKTIKDGGSADEALHWATANGLSDPECTPYSLADNAAPFPVDRSGRTVKIPEHVRIPVDSREQAKKWLHTVGPMVCWFKVYDCFFDQNNVKKGVVYRKKADSKEAGGHLMLIVGYDDDARCWIVKNSWGTGWGDGGYVRIAYGECGIESYAFYGVQHTDPDPLVRGRMHNGGMVECGNGWLHRNFEVMAKEGASVRHLKRDEINQFDANFPWNAVETFGTDVAGHPQVISTTDDRAYELVYRTTDNQLHAWSFDQKAQKWNDLGVFGPNTVVGDPALVQYDTYRQVIFLTSDGQMNHWARGGGKRDSTYHLHTTFAKGVQLASPAVVTVRELDAQKKIVRNGLDLITVSGGKMQVWQMRGGFWAKEAQESFGENIKSPPCLVEGQYGTNSEKLRGNYEVCVAVGGKMEHWSRRNDQPGRPWGKSMAFSIPPKEIDRVLALVEGSFGFNPEAIVLRTDGVVQHIYRHDPKGIVWAAGWELPVKVQK